MIVARLFKISGVNYPIIIHDHVFDRLTRILKTELTDVKVIKINEWRDRSSIVI